MIYCNNMAVFVEAIKDMITWNNFFHMSDFGNFFE